MTLLQITRDTNLKIFFFFFNQVEYICRINYPIICFAGNTQPNVNFLSKLMLGWTFHELEREQKQNGNEVISEGGINISLLGDVIHL